MECGGEPSFFRSCPIALFSVLACLSSYPGLWAHDLQSRSWTWESGPRSKGAIPWCMILGTVRRRAPRSQGSRDALGPQQWVPAGGGGRLSPLTARVPTLPTSSASSEKLARTASEAARDARAQIGRLGPSAHARRSLLSARLWRTECPRRLHLQLCIAPGHLTHRP